MNVHSSILEASATRARVAPIDAPPASVVKILEGALSAIRKRGARRLSMRDVSEDAGVSRGTLYRYFSTKEEVLAAVAEHVSSGFESGIREAAEGHDDPIALLRSVIAFFDRYTVERSPDRIFEVEPKFHLDFLRSHFDRHCAALCDALAPSFDHVDALAGRRLDRRAIAEALIRLQLSTMIVPARPDWHALWIGGADGLTGWLIALAGNSPATQEK